MNTKKISPGKNEKLEFKIKLLIFCNEIKL